MIISDLESLKIPNKGGIKGIKSGQLYIPSRTKTECQCDCCSTVFETTYKVAINKSKHYCSSCRSKGERNGMYGKGYLVTGVNNPYYGKTHTEEWKNSLSIKSMGVDNPFYGKHHSDVIKELLSTVSKDYTKTEEYRLNMSKTVTGRRHSEESKKKISLGNKKSLETRNTFKRSSLELRFEDIIISLGFTRNTTFIVQKSIKYNDTYKFYDFFFPDSNLLIEIDGNYWHSLPHHIENDKIKTTLALINGFKLVRISEERFKDANFIDLVKSILL